MALVYKIQRENKELKEIIKWLTDNESTVKDFIFGVRYCDGNMELNCEGVPLETLCTMSKMLDMQIDSILMDNNPEEFFIDIETDNGEN